MIPQLADGAEVLERIEVPDDVSLSVLIPNERGLENALALRERFHEVNVFLSASESHNRANVNRSVEESLSGLERVLGRARSEGLRCEGVISVAFGCPYEGHVPPERVFEIAGRLVAAGAVEIGFGDTTGMANPAQVREFFPAARAALGDEVELTAHFHNTRGQGLANVLAALDAGVRELRVELRRAGRLPGAARRHRQHRDRGPGVDAARDGRRDRRLARAPARRGARGAGGPRAAAGLARAHCGPGRMELAPLTTLRLGGPARELIEARSESEVIEAARHADLILAGGSNVVIADEGVPGIVARIVTRGVERDGARLTVAAGEEWDPLVAMCVAEGLQGFECLSGIPGSVGATPIQNVGAYGQEVAETVESVRVFDRETGRVEDMTPAECGFVYRGSVFKYHDRRIVLSVTFRMNESPTSGPLRYAELARALDVPIGGSAPLADVREAVLALRRGKGMVIDPADPDSVSAGSFFTNPILDRAPEGAPAWPEPDGRVKTSAAWLIEQAGFHKGYGDGRVGISTKHTLALINRGGATTAELMSLAHEIAAGVQDRFGIALHPEPVLVGHNWRTT